MNTGRRPATPIWRRARGAAWLLLAALQAPAAAAVGPDRLARLAEQAVRDALSGEARQVTVQARIDRRARMPDCAEPVAVTLPSRLDTSSVTATLRCAGPRPWTLYVPVSVARRVRVAVLRVALTRGQTLRRDHVEFAERDAASLPRGWFGEDDFPEGRTARRHLQAGAALSPADLEAPKLVRRGQQVTLVAREGGIQVRARGTALAAGAAGDWIRVRNASSGRIIEGRVRSADEVEVPM